MRTRGSTEEEWEAALAKERIYAAYNGLRSSEVADALNMTAAEVNRLRKVGVLHGINTREPGKRPQYRYLRSEVEALRELLAVAGSHQKLQEAAASLRRRADRLDALADELGEATAR